VLFNPYVLDFFSLARGYGLALTFQAWDTDAAEHLNKPFEARNWKVILLLSAFILASNLSYLYSVMDFLSLLPYRYLRALKKRSHPTAKRSAGYSYYLHCSFSRCANLLFIRY